MQQTRTTHLAMALGLLSVGIGAGRFLETRYPGGSDALESAQQLSEAFHEISERVSPGVVSVTAYERREAGGRSRLVQRQQGSGVIVGEDGIVVTNNHVVTRADEVKVNLADGREVTARIVGTDVETDLAVLRLARGDYGSVELAPSDPKVGEWVLAMGNPFGFGHTVTTGIISGKGRSDLNIATYEDFLQTDAAINPGNSGGPLVNLHGEVVGINTAIGTRASGSNGIGFAIPSRMVRRVLDGILTDGRVRRGYLGVEMDENSRRLGYAGKSLVAIDKVLRDSPARKAGLRAGDVIIALDGRPIVHRRDLLNMIADIDPGTQVEIDLWRDGDRIRLPVKLAERNKLY